MPMWVIWKSDSRSGSQRGFTLLELLVVVVLIGLIAGIVAPRFIGFGERLTLKNQLLEVRQRVNGLPLAALRGGRQLRIDSDGAPLSLPDGWRVTSRTSVLYQGNGSCLGGEIEVWRGSQREARVTLLPPLCQWSS